jgi:hypothetical protein
MIELTWLQISGAVSAGESGIHKPRTSSIPPAMISGRRGQDNT